MGKPSPPKIFKPEWLRPLVELSNHGLGAFNLWLKFNRRLMPVLERQKADDMMENIQRELRDRYRYRRLQSYADPLNHRERMTRAETIKLLKKYSSGPPIDDLIRQGLVFEK